jgi:hypothetical protein
MDQLYIDSLRVLREAFGPNSETSQLAEIIRSHFCTRTDVAMLDVGIGDGSSARKVTGSLVGSGIRVQLTGVDPYIPEDAFATAWPVTPELRVGRLEDLDIKVLYDVVNATQSLYYLGELGLALKRLVSLLDPSGLLTITVWDDGCTLKKLHDEFLAPTYRSPSSAMVVDRLVQVLPAEWEIRVDSFEGTIALGPRGASVRLAEALIGISGRGSRCSDAEKARALDYINTLGPQAPRRNAIISASAVGPTAVVRAANRAANEPIERPHS